MIIADTDVLIDSLNGRQPVTGVISQQLSSGVLATTAVSAFELLSGARTDRARQQVQTLLAALHIIPFDAAAAQSAADARFALERIGQTIGTADYLIAGICLSRSAQLFTRNRAHFSRIAELRLVELGSA